MIFDKYEIIRRLALGGMGEVFLAREKSRIVDRFVILKSLLPELAEQDGFIEQFLDEARVAATLNHPNIVSIYEVGLWQGVYFIAMEHIHGGDLSRLQKSAGKKGKGIPFQVSAHIVMDAALGLDHAHNAVDVHGNALEIVHRDISPQNIMVRGDGVTKVVDFGIAKAANRETRTQTGMLKGKLQYMPPEQINSAPLDGRSDQFSLGVVLWELCTGRRLFKGENEIQTLERVLRAPILKPSDVIEGFPAPLEAVIMRMLQREPEKRFAKISDAAAGLRHYLESCEQKTAKKEVAQFVSAILGDELAQSTKSIVPAKDNFLISLDQSGPFEQMTPTTNRTLVRKPSKVIWALGALFALALLVFGFLLFRPTQEVELDELPTPVVALDYKFDSDSGAFEVTSPKGALLYINGREHDQKSPFKVMLKGNSHVEVRLGERSLLRKAFATKASTVEVKKVEVSIDSRPPGATVYEGEQALGKTPLRIALALGETKNFALQKSGYADARLTFAPSEKDKKRLVTLKKASKKSNASAQDKKKKEELAKAKANKELAKSKAQRDRARIQDAKDAKAAREKKALEAKEKAAREALEKERREKAALPGTLRVSTIPWAKVYIKGKGYGTTPLRSVSLKAGTYTVRFVNSKEGIDTTRKVTIKAGKLTKEKFTLK